ncbi:hypothetical protein [Nocardia carnea]|uniref:Uncharacterized protein n=1 Tax=Nocardia carnea TaxID=37328 RepID=A0ABW7TPL4_9NOCA|nr:hypothetical protein [Nocardia carnea]
MTGTDYRQPEGIAEFAEELRLLAEAVLERVEPVLRDAAADDKPEWGNCTWCPLCAAAALVRGEQHEVLATVAAHGTAIVTILREALAGEPVDPVMPNGHGAGSAAAHGRSGTGHQHGHGTAADSGDQPPAGESTAAADDREARPDTGAPAEPTAGAAASGRSRYVGIPITIKP